MINLSKKLIRQVAQANAKFGLIKDGDKVLLGLSGGKDSLALAHLLKECKLMHLLNSSLKQRL